MPMRGSRKLPRRFGTHELNDCAQSGVCRASTSKICKVLLGKPRKRVWVRMGSKTRALANRGEVGRVQ